MSLDDKFGEALRTSLSFANGKKVLYAFENNLQGAGAASMLEARKWVCADFTRNYIGTSITRDMARFVNAVANPNGAMLLDVNLSYNKLKDRPIIQLARALINCKQLKRLELSHNDFGDKAAIALGEALLINRSVEELGIGWNKVGRQGSAAFAAGLVINEGITTLDLSGWPYGSKTQVGLALQVRSAGKKNGGKNNKGKQGNANPNHARRKKLPNVETIKEDLRISATAPKLGEHVDLKPYAQLVPLDVLAEVFKNNARLTHLDLSYCNLNSERIIKSFPVGTNTPPVTLLDKLSDSLQNNHTLLGIHLRGNAIHIDCRGFLQHGSAKTPHTLNIGGQTDSRGMASELSGDRFRFTFDDSCWLCDGWTEQTFYADKADRKAAAKQKSQQKGDEEDDEPPLVLSLSFENWNSFPLRVRRDDPESDRNTKLARMVPPQPFRHYIRKGTKEEQFQETLGNTCVKPSTDDWRHKKVHFHMPKRRGIAEPLVILAETALPRMLKNDGTLATDKFVRKKKRKQPPPPEDPMKWLRKDWKKTKVTKFIKDEEERNRCLSELAQHALLLREVYQYYAFQGTGSAFTISRNEITQLVREMGILDKKNMKIADLDLIFVSVNVETGEKAKQEENSDTELERFEYVETLVRIAIEKFKNKKKPSESEPFHVRIRTLLERHVVPNALAIIAQADGVDEFEVAMEAEEDELEELTFENEVLLRDLYAHYCTQNEDERLRKRGLQMNSFLLLFDQADLLDLELTKLETKQSFIDSQDDTENSDQRLCDFEEFVEGCIRCANEKWEDGIYAEYSVCQKYTMLLEAFATLKKRLKKDFNVIFASVQENRNAVRKQRMAELNAMKAKQKKKKKKSR
jgi:hypothetical protein